MIEISTATEKDIPIIEEILLDAVNWLDATGQSLWRSDQITWARLSKDFAASDFLIAYVDGNPAACMALVDYDPVVWPGIEKGKSLFIHKLAVKRNAAGLGLPAALFARAKVICVDREIWCLRLDCDLHRAKLRGVYERSGFTYAGQKVVYEIYDIALYECKVDDVRHLYHYYERSGAPFRTLTSLPYAEAERVVRSWFARQVMFDVDRFLNLRYERDKLLRELYGAIGGKPIRTAPVYFTLGPNQGMSTWFDDPAWIKIPIEEFDLHTVSFTYGDSFAALDPELNTGEEWWGRVFDYKRVLSLIERYGWPEDPPYHMKNRVFPEDRHINHCLKFVEAHVWSDEVLDRYR